MPMACYSLTMSFIQVKHVPVEVHAAVRARAAAEGMTVSEYVLDLLRRDLAFPSQRQWMARVRSREPVDIRSIDAVDAVRAEREDEIGGTGS